MEGLADIDENGWGFLLMVFIVGILPAILALVQLPLAVVLTIRRMSPNRGIAGWFIYWIMTIPYLIYFMIAEKHGMANIPNYFLLCYIPAIWFFFAGKFSDKRSTINTKINAQ
jgi:hypothetical protein